MSYRVNSPRKLHELELDSSTSPLASNSSTSSLLPSIERRTAMPAWKTHKRSFLVVTLTIAWLVASLTFRTETPSSQPDDVTAFDDSALDAPKPRVSGNELPLVTTDAPLKTTPEPLERLSKPISSPTVGNHNKTSYSVTLVTSFWAALPNSTQTPHRREIEAAILNNVNNPHFHQVVIILDGSSSQSNCTLFTQQMQELQRTFDTYLNNKNVTQQQHTTTDNNKPKLTCVDREQGQPNYYEMFMYATDPDIVTGEVVIVAKADQMFDDTAKWTQKISPNTILTLPTWGYDPKMVPASIDRYFQFLHGDSKKFQKGKLKISKRCWGMGSWDAYVFHRSLVHSRLQPEQFQRPSLHHGPAQFFRMNEIAAEWAGLHGLMANLPKQAINANGCKLVHTWHLHGFPKMHAHNDPQMKAATNEKYWDHGDDKDTDPFWVPKPHRLGDRKPPKGAALDALFVEKVE